MVLLYIKAGTLALAALMTEVTEPARLAATLVLVPHVAKFWNKLLNRNEEEQSNVVGTKSSVVSVPLKDRLLVMWKDYGKLTVATYLGVFAGTVGYIYLTLDAGILDADIYGFNAEKNCREALLQVLLR
jgi:hypothetical protein